MWYISKTKCKQQLWDSQENMQLDIKHIRYKNGQVALTDVGCHLLGQQYVSCQKQDKCKKASPARCHHHHPWPEDEMQLKENKWRSNKVFQISWWSINLNLIGLSHLFWRGKLIPNIVGYDLQNWLGSNKGLNKKGWAVASFKGSWTTSPTGPWIRLGFLAPLAMRRAQCRRTSFGSPPGQHRQTERESSTTDTTLSGNKKW